MYIIIHYTNSKVGRRRVRLLRIGNCQSQEWLETFFWSFQFTVATAIRGKGNPQCLLRSWHCRWGRCATRSIVVLGEGVLLVANQCMTRGLRQPRNFEIIFPLQFIFLVNGCWPLFAVSNTPVVPIRRALGRRYAPFEIACLLWD